MGIATHRSDVALPTVSIADWRPTQETLHIFAQIVGKVRAATTPPRNHWWHVALYVNSRGLTTGPLLHNGRTFEILIDLSAHQLVVQTLDNQTCTFLLGEGLSVADFDRQLHAALEGLGVDVAIREEPFGMSMPTPFREDSAHAHWDCDAVERFHRTLVWSHSVLEEFGGWFVGKQSPAHFMWQSFDLSLTRFSGRPARVKASDLVNREAYSHEASLFGFCMGNQWTLPDACYFAFIVPEPEGLRDLPVVGGDWSSSGIAVLPYESVRTASDPRRLLLAFLQSAYEAAAGLADWDVSAFESAWCPGAERLQQLRSGALAEF